MSLLSLKESLEALYRQFNTPARIHPDPLELVRRYPDSRDREIAGLTAACLAYGRVQTILKSVASVLAPMGESPRDFIISHTLKDFMEIYSGFVHRFTRGEEVAYFLKAMRQALLNHGTLKDCFLAYYRPGDPNLHSALTGFILALRSGVSQPPFSLLSDPRKGSAMKRLNLFLRWMVRHDRVDPGGWDEIPTGKLIFPLDTHIHAFGLRYNLTKKKNANLKAALEITEAFKALSPRDPVKYDFAISHLGILGFDNLDPEGRNCK